VIADWRRRYIVPRCGLCCFHPLQREFEEVIMVEVQIEEMFRSDRNRSITKLAVVVDAEVKENEQKKTTH
jgi:hypothetical protein